MHLINNYHFDLLCEFPLNHNLHHLEQDMPPFYNMHFAQENNKHQGYENLDHSNVDVIMFLNYQYLKNKYNMIILSYLIL